MVTPKFWSASDILVYFNFGLMKIRRTSDDIEVLVEVRDNKNDLRLSKTIQVNKDLKFKPSVTKYNKMCLYAHSKNKIIIQINHYLEILT